MKIRDRKRETLQRAARDARIAAEALSGKVKAARRKVEVVPFADLCDIVDDVAYRVLDDAPEAIRADAPVYAGMVAAHVVERLHEIGIMCIWGGPLFEVSSPRG